ncbi:MAG: hypothetical protein ABI639_10770 [Thermoanaerobaculia bacterium]
MNRTGRQILAALCVSLGCLGAPTFASTSGGPIAASQLSFATSSENCVLEVSIIGGQLFQRKDYRVYGDGRVTQSTTAMNGEVFSAETAPTFLPADEFAALKAQVLETRLYQFTEADMQERLAASSRRPTRVSGAPWAEIIITLESVPKSANENTQTEQKFKVEMVGAGVTANLSSDIPEYAAAAKLFHALAQVGKKPEEGAAR